MHSGAAAIGMHPPSRAKRDARHAVSGQVHSVRARAPNDECRRIARDLLPCRAQRLDDRNLRVKLYRRIGDVDMQRRFHDSLPLAERSQHAAQVAFDRLH